MSGFVGRFLSTSGRLFRCGRSGRPVIPAIAVLLCSFSTSGGAATVTFQNTTPITIKEKKASPYGTSISVAGVTGTLANVQVILTGFNLQASPATSPAKDVQILLVGPTGAAYEMLTDFSCLNAIAASPLQLDDNASAYVDCPGLSGTMSGWYRPTDKCLGTCPGIDADEFPPDAPPGDHNPSLYHFTYLDPNGVWTLYVYSKNGCDLDGCDTIGGISGGWQIIFTYTPTAPTATTGSASGISATGGTLNGTVNPNGSATTGYFQYGLTTSYGSVTPTQSLGSGTSAVSVGGGTVTGLQCATTYHFRVVGANGGGTVTGSDATFTTSACPMNQLTVTRNGTGGGTVTSSPAGIDCGSTCAASFAHGTNVVLTAVASSTSDFAGWTGEGCSSSMTCTVSMTQARSVAATFNTKPAQALTVTKLGTGSGTVTSSPPGIDCGTGCSSSFAYGSTVTLTAVASGTSEFVGWSGAGCGGLGSCVVSMTQAHTVTAMFGLAPKPLTVTRNGTGGGTVTSSPAGIDCGSTCAASFAHGTTVILTALASSTSDFAGWTGEGCGSSTSCTVSMTQARSVAATFNTKPAQALTVTRLGTGSGTVTSSPPGIDCGAGCAASFAYGSTVTLAAVASGTSDFVGWSGGGCGGLGPCVVSMTQAHTVSATFNAKAPQLLSVSKSGSGTVTSVPSGISCDPACSSSFDFGTQVVLSASPDSGWSFAGWSGEGCSSGTCTVSMTQARNVTASFTPPPAQALSISKTGTGTGSVLSSPAGIDCGPTCSASFAWDTIVSLTAVGTNGSRFDGWTGEGCSGVQPCSVRMSQQRLVSASFSAPLPQTLSVTKTGSGSGTVTSSPAGISCGSTCSAAFPSGASVTLSAAAATGSAFAGWSGEGCSANATCTVSMTQARNVSASFMSAESLTSGVPLTRTLNASISQGTWAYFSIGVPGGARRLEVTLTGLSGDVDLYTNPGAVPTHSTNRCVSAASGSYPESCVESSPAGGTWWIGVNNRDVGSLQFTITATVLMAVTTYKAGQGTGLVTSAPAGLDCGTTCEALFPLGSPLTLTATPLGGSSFSSWSAMNSHCSGASPTCSTTVSESFFATAYFNAPPASTLTVTKAGTGTGTVTSSPSGIDCGASCAATYAYGTSVVLTATSASGMTFTGWSGEGCGGVGTCTVSMTQARNATASFASCGVTVLKAGSGSGTVTSTPSGLSCGSTCGAPFSCGSSVTLAAAPATGSSFAGWSGGGCSGTGACSLTADENTTVTATFITIDNLLNVNVTGSGTGSVTSSPAGISCGASCSATFTYGTNVTLSAFAADGSTFNGWYGEGCSGTGTCTISMTQARSVSADFAPPSSQVLVVTKAGGGTGTVTSTPMGIDCGPTCAASFPYNTSLALQASALGTSSFAGWSGEGCSGTAPCFVTMSQGRSVTATFTPPADPTLTVTKSGGSASTGQVTSIPAGVDCGVSCSSTFPLGSLVTLTAVPKGCNASGCSAGFDGWSGAGCTLSGPTCSVTMDAAKGVTATFVPSSGNVFVSFRFAGSGSGVLHTLFGDLTSNLGGYMTSGNKFTSATAQPSAGSRFSGWSEGCAGTELTCTVSLTRNRVLKATFDLLSFPLTVEKAGSGDGRVTSTPVGIDCGPTCVATLNSNVTATLTAAPSFGSAFAGWYGEGCAGTGTCTVSMTQARNVRATFNLIPPQPLTVLKTGAGTGDVSSSPAGIACGPTCSTGFAYGSSVVLGAAATGGSSFAGWSGEGCSGTGSCMVGMTQARLVTATFRPPTLPVSVTLTGSGGGSVTSTPSGISCAPTCTASFDQGSLVTLAAQPSAGSCFRGWTGEGCSGTGTCTVTASQARSVMATFGQAPSASVTGGGTVCVGSTATVQASLSGTPPWNVTWSDGVQQNGVTTPSVTRTVSPGATTTYSVSTVSDAYCSAAGSGSALVTVSQKPTATVSGTASVCSGGSTSVSATLTGAPPWTVSWSDGVVQSGLATPIATHSVTPSSSRSYSVTAVADANCVGTASGSAFVAVDTPPAPPVASNDGPICTGQDLHLTASGAAGGSFVWTGPNGFVSTDQNPTIPAIGQSGAGTYSVSTTVGGCTSPAATTAVTVRQAPTATVSGSQAICTGSTASLQVSLTGTPPWRLTWSDGEVQTGIVSSPAARPVAPGSTTVFSVVGVSDASCSGVPSGTAVVTVNAPPTATVSGSATTYVGGTTPIEAVLTGTGPWNLTWSDGFVQNGVPSSPATRVLTPASPGTFTYGVSAVSDVNCHGTATGSAVVTVNSQPTAAVSGSASICAGSSTTIQAALTGTGPWNLTWSDGFTQTGVTASPVTRSVSPASTLTYTVTSFSDANYSGTSVGSAVVAVDPKPTAVASGSATICAGSSATIEAVLSGVGPWSITWSDGFSQSGVTASPATRSVSPTSTTTYTIASVSDSRCSGTASGSAVVTVNPAPARPTISAPSSVAVGSTGNGASVPAHAGSTYQWTVTNGTITSGQGTSQITFTAGSAGSLTLDVVETASGCASPKATATVTVAGASQGKFYTLIPCRVLDTRNAAGALGGPALAPGAVRVFPVTSACNVPASARAVSVNVTVTSPSHAGFLTLFPSDATAPLASVINFRPGQTRANNAIVKLPSAGTGGVSVLNGSSGTVDLILDVNGYFE